MQHATCRPPHAGATGLPVSPGDLLERVDPEFLVGDDPLQPDVLALQLAQPFGVVGLHPAVLVAPAAVGLLRDLDLLRRLGDGNGDCRQIEDPSDYLCIAPGDEADRADGWADTYAYHGGETESVTSTRTDVYVSALKISKHYSYYDDFNPASQDGPETNTRLANHVKLATEPGALSSFDLRPQEAEFISGLDADLSFDARIVAFDTRYESVVSHRERDHRGEGEGWVFVFRIYFETHQYQERHRVAVPAPTFNGSGSKPACAPQSEAVGQATKNAVYTTRADVGVGGRSAPSMKQMTFVKNGMVKTYKTDVRGDVVMGDDDDPVIEAVTVDDHELRPGDLRWCCIHLRGCPHELRA